MKKDDVSNQAVQEAALQASRDIFPKEAILKSRRYADRRDALSFLLKDGEEYSHEDVANILSDYMKGRVK